MTIQWGYHFFTGIRDVDHQHEGLVALVNNLNAVATCHTSTDEVENAFLKLTDYASEHFSLEEKLMVEAGVDVDHVAAHKQAHTRFVDQLTDMWHARGEDPDATTQHLLEFLTTWIYRHILITDHAMARDYYNKKGMTPPPSLLMTSESSRSPGKAA